ncbi:MAG: TRAP transporter substrate-binding protein [Pararhodobacter sp.]|nr:TRAP transporter substrate-binding protein [Pararhodobacter sp.]
MLNRTLGLALGVAMGLGALPAQAQEFTFRLAHYLPPMHNMAANVLPGWAERINEQSDGRIQIEIYPAGQLLQVDEIFDGVQAGVADIGWSMPGATPGRFPVMSVLELPFLFNEAENASQVLMEVYESGQMDAEFDGVKVLYLHTHAAGSLNTIPRVETLEDLQGLRMRFPSPAARMMLDQLGAQPVGVPAPQAYESLERGVLDGVAFPFDAMQGLRLGEQVNYHIDWPTYVLTFYLVMNENSFNALPEDLQQIIMDNSGMQEAIAVGRAWDESEISGRAYVQELGNEIYTLPEDEAERWVAAVMPGIDAFLEETEARGIPAREIYENAAARAQELAGE